MRQRSLVVTLVVTALLVLGVPFSRSIAAPPAVCLAVGDSLAAGIGSTLPRERSAAAILCQWSGEFFGERTELVSTAVPGERTSFFLTEGQLDRLRETVEAAQRRGSTIRFVLVSLGGNDLLALQNANESERDRAFAEFQTNIGEALAAIRRTVGEVPLLVLTLYDPTEGDPGAERSESWWVARFNSELRTQASAVGASVVDLESLFRGHSAEWTWWPVDVHPTNEGYEAIARAAWKALGWDQEAPQIRIERPRDGEQVDRRYLTVRARVTDAGGVERVSLWVDGQEVGTLDPLSERDEWITLWETPWPMAGPPITLEVRAEDRAGNEGRAAVRLERFSE
uniref:Lipolytic protein G-D-S-L n=1 Tax=Thermomicrobium roseum TaxID=500 RepID=A0A7C5RU90_THERO